MLEVINSNSQIHYDDSLEASTSAGRTPNPENVFREALGRLKRSTETAWDAGAIVPMPIREYVVAKVFDSNA